MIISRLFYHALLWLLLPYVFFHLLWRGRKQPQYRRRIGERFGNYATPASEGPLLWLHTVSVGETRAVVTLVQSLQRDYPAYRILLTHTTPTGMASSEQLFGDSVQRVYLPYDYPFAVRRFLNQFHPQLGVLLETEIWPNLIHACRVSGIPLLLLNARLSARSAAGYARFPALTRSVLAELSGVAAQTEEDATRLVALGAKQVSVMGNLKFDIEPPIIQLEQGRRLRILLGVDRPVFLAASTREGEEALLLAELTKNTAPGLLTVIVPRHPQRFDEVAMLVEKLGLRYQRRSAGQPIAPETQVLLGDSMGEMFAYYVACDLAFIGGSLLPFGGQNLLEACTVGKPVLLGPHTYNFAQASELAIRAGAARRIQNANHLLQLVGELLGNPLAMQEMGHQGLSFVTAHRGATQRALERITPHLAIQERPLA